jgi:hypothetical protein
MPIRKKLPANDPHNCPDKPFFDTELRELWVNNTLVKRLDCRATNQILILTVLQEENWPFRIDDPLPPTSGRDRKDRLRSTIHSLNACQHGAVVRFFADGTGHGIRWELTRKSPAALASRLQSSLRGQVDSRGRC